MARRVLPLAPGLCAVLPWAILELVGARAEVVVITGTPPPSGDPGVLLGVAFVGAWLVAVILGPPLAAVGAAAALRRGSAPVDVGR